MNNGEASTGPGQVLSDLEKRRLEKIKRNEAKLKELGLDKPVGLGEATTRTTLRPKRPRNDTDTTLTRVLPVRKSRRILQKRVENDGIDMRSHIDIDEAIAKQRRAAKRKATAKRTNGKGRTRLEKVAMTEEEKSKLASMRSFLEEMEEFLVEVPHGSGNKTVSRQNCRSVMKQVTKLVTGMPITYHHWDEGVEFRVENGVNLGTDFVALYDQAKTFEDTHGRDLGNGWLLRHPIMKLGLYQDYVLSKTRKDTK